MNTLRLLAFALALTPAPARAGHPRPLNPTRLDWCASLLEVRDRKPADDARVLGTRALARARLDAIVNGFDTEAPPVAAHVRRVAANLRRGPLDLDHDRLLRESRGRLLGLARDFENPSTEYPALARVDLGRDAVLATLHAIQAGAIARTPDDVVPPLDTDYYVRSIGDVSALTTLAAAFALGTEHYWTDPNQNAFGLFLGATAMSLVGLWDVFKFHQKNLATPAGRVALENRFNRDRVNVEAHGVRRLERLTEYPTDEFFAHDGYSLYLPEASMRDLYARVRRPTPHRTSYLQAGRAPRALFVDLVLFEGDGGEPVLLTALRARPTRDVPKTLGSLRLLGDI